MRSGRSLSPARAETVRDHLAARGVATDRMIARGYGAMYPVRPTSPTKGVHSIAALS
jgi:outer membrane protein OmpA-like peptidoglycan-associated protein